MKIVYNIFKFQTKKIFDFIDITNQVDSFIRQSKIRNGLVNIQILHTSAALIFNENEPLLIKDIKKSLEKIAPQSLAYQHDDFSKRRVNMCKDECINGHSHCKAIYLLVNIVLNLIDRKLQLGQWQRIILAELDRARPRKVQVQIIGE